MAPVQHSINDVVWCEPFDGYATIIGVTAELHLCVQWFDDDGSDFKAIVSQSDCWPFTSDQSTNSN